MANTSTIKPSTSWAEWVSSTFLPQHTRMESFQDQIHILDNARRQSEIGTEVNFDHIASNSDGFVSSGSGIVPPSASPSPPPPPPPSPIDTTGEGKAKIMGDSGHCKSFCSGSEFFTPPSSPVESTTESDTTDVFEPFFGGDIMPMPPSPPESDDEQEEPCYSGTLNLNGLSQVEHTKLVGALPPSLAKILEPSSIHVHSEDCGCPVLKSVASHTVSPTNITPEAAPILIVSRPGAGPHTHGPTCGCTWKDLEPGKLSEQLREFERHGEIESAARKPHGYSHPLLPKRQPMHRTLVPGKPCIKSVPKAELDSGRSDDGHYETIPEAESAIGKAKSVSFNNAIEATLIRKWQKPWRKPEGRLRRHAETVKTALKRMCRIITSDSDEDDEDLSQLSDEDREIRRRIARANDFRDANEKAAIRRGALDFMMAVCVKVDTPYCELVDWLVDGVEFRGIGSYVGEEREFANVSKRTKTLPDSWYRSKETSMSWGKQNGRNGLYNVTRIGTTKQRDLPW